MAGRAPPDPVYTLRGVGGPVSCLKFQTDTTLYSGDATGQAHIWDMKTRRITATFTPHPGHSVLWLDFVSHDRLLSQGRDGSVKLWQSKGSEWFNSGQIQSSAMGFCAGTAFQRGNNVFIAVPSETQSEVEVFDVSSLQSVAKLQPDTDSTHKLGMCMALSNTGAKDADTTTIVIGYEDGSVALWDLRTNKMVDVKRVHPETLMCMGFSPVTNTGFSGAPDCDIMSWKVVEDKGLQLKDKVTLKNPGLSAIVVRPDGKVVVSAGWDCNVRLFGGKKLRPLAVLAYHKESVHCLAFSPDNILACGSKDQHISLWDIYR